AKDPGQRYQSMAELAQELRQGPRRTMAGAGAHSAPLTGGTRRHTAISEPGAGKTTLGASATGVDELLHPPPRRSRWMLPTLLGLALVLGAGSWTVFSGKGLAPTAQPAVAPPAPPPPTTSPPSTRHDDEIAPAPKMISVAIT